MFGGECGGVVVYFGLGCGGVGGGSVGLWGVVVGFAYWCGACHAGLLFLGLPGGVWVW